MAKKSRGKSASRNAAKGAPKRTGKAAARSKTRPPRLLIVEARYYPLIADKLLTGATQVFDAAGATYDLLTVPGALEIPAAIAIALDDARAKRAPYDGVVALGCVIEGETYHFEVVANESARGLTMLAINERIAVGNGILTVDKEDQAHDRAGGDHGNKGADAARAVLAMVALKQSLKDM